MCIRDSHDCVPAVRPVARGGLGISRLGGPPWTGPGGGTALSRQALPAETPGLAPHLPVRQHRLGVFPGGQRGTGRRPAGQSVPGGLGPAQQGIRRRPAPQGAGQRPGLAPGRRGPQRPSADLLAPAGADSRGAGSAGPAQPPGPGGALPAHPLAVLPHHSLSGGGGAVLRRGGYVHLCQFLREARG